MLRNNNIYIYEAHVCLITTLEESSLKGNKIERWYAHSHYVYPKYNFIMATRKMTSTHTN